MKYKSHGELRSFVAPWRPPLQRGTRVAGARDGGAPGGTTPAFSPHPALHFLSRIETSPQSAPVPHSSARCGCTQACQHKLVTTTLRKPDQPIATGVGPPLWEVPCGGPAHGGDLNTPTGQGSSWRTDFWAGLISIGSGNGPPSLPSSYRRWAPHWPWPACGPGSTDSPHLPPWLWLRRRLEMTSNTNKTHLHHESTYQQVKCWNAWIWLPTFPRNFYRNLNTPNHPQWKMDSGMAWEMSEILNWMPNKWNTWPTQDMDLDRNNFGLSPMSTWIYICIHILYIYIFL